MHTYRIEAIVRPDTRGVELLQDYRVEELHLRAESEEQARRQAVGDCQMMCLIVDHFFSINGVSV